MVAILFTFGAKDEVDGESDEDGERQEEPRGLDEIGRERGLFRKNGHGVDGVRNMNAAGHLRATKTRGL